MNFSPHMHAAVDSGATDPVETVVADPGALAVCLEHLDACPVIGFDTEFIGEQTYIPDLCLIQVSTPEQLILIDPLASGPLDAFWKRIIDPNRVVVVHAGREEIRLCHFASGELPGNLFDVQIAAGLLGLGYPLGYGPLIQEVLGIRLSKAETLTNWRVRPLSEEQLRYAYDDVRFLLPLWRRLSDRLRALDRLGWLREEIETLKHRAVVEGPAVEKWRKLRGVGSLDRKRLAAVREVYAWREEKAAHLNRPSRTVLRDDLIVEIARRTPRTEKDLQALRGLGKVDFMGILEAVNRARDLPPDEWPEAAERDNDPPQVNLIAGLLGAVLADVCARKEITTGIAATASDVKALVRARLHGNDLPEESHLTRGWRRESLLFELLAVLDGKRGLRIGDLKKTNPFDYDDGK
jgi:ribonuclease D